MINREMKSYTIKTYGGKDEYGQPLATLQSTKTIEAAVGIYTHTAVNDIRYQDIKYYALTKDTSITDKDYIVIDGEEHKIMYVNNTTRYTQLMIC